MSDSPDMLQRLYALAEQRKSADPETSYVARLHAKLASACAGPPPAMAFEPKVGAVCAARFSQDNEWYRAKVTKRDKGRLPAPLLDRGSRGAG